MSIISIRYRIKPRFNLFGSPCISVWILNYRTLYLSIDMQDDYKETWHRSKNVNESLKIDVSRYILGKNSDKWQWSLGKLVKVTIFLNFKIRYPIFRIEKLFMQWKITKSFGTAPVCTIYNLTYKKINAHRATTELLETFCCKSQLSYLFWINFGMIFQSTTFCFLIFLWILRQKESY